MLTNKETQRLYELVCKIELSDIKELQETISDIKEIKIKEEADNLTNSINELIEKSGIPLNEILPRLSKQKPKKIIKPKAKPKYQNPEDNSQTWSGRGKTPAWAIPHKENGTLDDCLI